MSFLHVRGTKIVNEQDEEIVLRGAGLGGWMMMENFISGFPGCEFQIREALKDAIGKEKAEFFFDKYLENFFAEDDARFFKSLGLNCIRIAVNYRHFEDDMRPRTLKPTAFTHLDRVISLCSTYGIYTIIDMHAAPGGQSGGWHADGGTHFGLFWRHKDFQDRFVWLWGQIAERYKENGWVAGYNVLNEPADPTPGAKRLIVVYDRVIQRIREVDERHMVFLDGNTFATDFSGFPEDVRDGKRWGSNVVFAFHDYAVEGFPGERGEDYEGTEKQVEEMRKRYERKRKWMDERGLCVWNGEWGPVYARREYDGEATDEINRRREKVLSDQLKIYEKDKLSWSIWLYKDIGFQGMVCVSGDTAYMKHFKGFLERKHWLAVDAWGKDDTRVREIYEPVCELIKKKVVRDESDLKLYPPIWRVDERVTRISRTILVAEFLIREWADQFRGLDLGQLRSLAESFRFELCHSRTGLNRAISGEMLRRDKQLPDLDDLDSPLISSPPPSSIIGRVPGSALAEKIFNDPDSWQGTAGDDSDLEDPIAWLADEVEKYQASGDQLLLSPIDRDRDSFSALLKPLSDKFKLDDNKQPFLPLLKHAPLDLSLNMDLRLSKIWDSKQTYSISHPKRNSTNTINSTNNSGRRPNTPPALDLDSPAGNVWSPMISPPVASASATWSILELYGVTPNTPNVSGRTLAAAAAAAAATAAINPPVIPTLQHLSSKPVSSQPPSQRLPSLPPLPKPPRKRSASSAASSTTMTNTTTSTMTTPARAINTKLSDTTPTAAITTPIRRLPVVPSSNPPSNSNSGPPSRCVTPSSPTPPSAIRLPTPPAAHRSKSEPFTVTLTSQQQQHSKIQLQTRAKPLNIKTRSPDLFSPSSLTLTRAVSASDLATASKLKYGNSSSSSNSNSNSVGSATTTTTTTSPQGRSPPIGPRPRSSTNGTPPVKRQLSHAQLPRSSGGSLSGGGGDPFNATPPRTTASLSRATGAAGTGIAARARPMRLPSLPLGASI